MTARVVTRFAPSPTGYLHIGGARTALFNWLYARRHGGTFLLRVEDTDKKRSTDEAIDAIFAGMRWLGLDWDGDAVFQSKGAARHAEIAAQLLHEGKAYKCYATPEELKEMREAQRAAGQSIGYDGRWRDRPERDAPEGQAPVIRFKAPHEGETVIDDQVQGKVTVANETLDDMVLLRADGSPTYMLSVVVDDHDMGITHAIRGDDHLTNAFRQTQLFEALNWTAPVFAHIPLIHGPDGAKLSKRHGALGVDAYRDMGLLPDAMRNYLLRLGWSHGDDEIISTDQAIEWFNLEAIGRGPARFDMAKLTNLNAHYIKESDPEALAKLARPTLEEKLAHPLTADEKTLWQNAVPSLQDRAKTLLDLAEIGLFYFKARPLEMDEKSAKILDQRHPDVLNLVSDKLEALQIWSHEAIEAAIRAVAEELELGFGKVAQPVRAALCGQTNAPGIFDVIYVLGKEQTLGRLADQST